MFEPSSFDNPIFQMQKALENAIHHLGLELMGGIKHLPQQIRKALEQGKMGSMSRSFIDQSGAVQKLKKDLAEVGGSIRILKNHLANLSAVKTGLDNAQKTLINNWKKYNRDIMSKIAKATSSSDKIDLQDQRSLTLGALKKKLEAIQKNKEAITGQMNLQEISLGRITKLHDQLLAQLNAARLISAAQLGLNLLIEAAIWGAVSGYRELRIRGEAGTQALANLGEVFLSKIRLMSQGVFASMADVAKVGGQIGNRLGTVDFAPELLDNSVFLMKHMKLTEEQSARLGTTFYRMSGFSTKTAASSLIVAENLARKNLYPAGTLMRQMADDTEIFARHASQGAQAFARAEMFTARAGTNLKNIEGFADRLVGDFESSLKMQAELQTYMPDFDFSEIMFASQFGSSEDVTKSLMTQLKGRDISKMPRSFQMAIQKSLGFSFEELQSLSKGIEPGKEGFKGYQPGDETRGIIKTWATSVADMVAENYKLVSSIILAATALQMLATSTLFNNRVTQGIIASFGQTTLGKLIGSRALPIAGAGIAGLITGMGAFASSKGAGNSTGTALKKALTTGGLTSALSLGGAVLGSFLGPLGTVGGGMLGGLLGSMFGGKIAAGIHHRGGMVGSSTLSRMVGSSNFLGAGRFHTGLLPNEFPSILQKGEAVLTGMQQNKIAQITNIATEAAIAGKIMGDHQGGISRIGAASFADSVDLKRVELLLSQLIRVTKEGKVIAVDGREVGKTVLNSYSRD